MITLLVMIHIITSHQGHLQNKKLLDKQRHVEKNMRTYDTLHRSETQSFWYKQSWWWKKKEKSWYIEEVCVWTCCHRKNLMQCDCVIFLKKNYDIDNSNIADALSSRYREVGNKESICKPCHTKLQHKSLEHTQFELCRSQ